jgi:hypothetical protein
VLHKKVQWHSISKRFVVFKKSFSHLEAFSKSLILNSS